MAKNQDNKEGKHEVYMAILDLYKKQNDGITYQKRPDCPNESVINDYTERMLIPESKIYFSETQKKELEQHVEECDYCLSRITSLTQMWFEIQDEEVKGVEARIDDMNKQFDKKLQTIHNYQAQ